VLRHCHRSYNVIVTTNKSVSNYVASSAVSAKNMRIRLHRMTCKQSCRLRSSWHNCLQTRVAIIRAAARTIMTDSRVVYLYFIMLPTYFLRNHKLSKSCMHFYGTSTTSACAKRTKQQQINPCSGIYVQPLWRTFRRVDRNCSTWNEGKIVQ